MKFQSFLFFAALCAIALFSSCKSDSTAAKAGAAENGNAQTAPGAPVIDPAAAPAPAAAPPPATAPAATPEPAQNAAGVWHYTCSKGCAGGAATATACAKCGTTLSHNQAYHGAATPAGAAGAPGQTPTITMPNTKQPEPPQNKAGVWHYVCPDGHAGGGGGATPCSKCSKTLVHNKAYHE